MPSHWRAVCSGRRSSYRGWLPRCPSPLRRGCARRSPGWSRGPSYSSVFRSCLPPCGSPSTGTRTAHHALAMPVITDALELLTAQHEQIEDLYEQVRQIGDESAFIELVDKLNTHLALEAELFYPAVKRHLPDPLREELLAEHAAIRKVLGDLQWHSLEDATFRAQLDALGTLLF